MINEEFLKELGLNEDAIASIITKNKEADDKRKFQEILKKSIKRRNPYDIDLVLQLFDTENLEYKNEEIEGLEERLNEFEEKYHFLFKDEDIPQIVSSTKPLSDLTAEEFKNMTYTERAELYKKNPKLYRRLLNA